MRLFLIGAWLLYTLTSIGQTRADSINDAINRDDSIRLASLINKDSVNNCFPDPGSRYSLLSETVRAGAVRCFNLLIGDGADPNNRCNGYVPPLMHAAKYGRLYMAKVLISKGADPNYVYEGDYAPANGKTPLQYAQDWNQSDVADYLRSLNNTH